jgi:hypothetical protein
MARKIDNPQYDAGYDDGLARDENPHPEGTQAEQDWEDGWDDADSDSDDGGDVGGES